MDVGGKVTHFMKEHVCARVIGRGVDVGEGESLVGGGRGEGDREGLTASNEALL